MPSSVAPAAQTAAPALIWRRIWPLPTNTSTAEEAGGEVDIRREKHALQICKVGGEVQEGLKVFPDSVHELRTIF